ncbi:MAG: hypothetical protein H7281_17710 [Bacteriovorax sp.]|nr:hypothetical protein [Bacteriovorax sp.]
MSNIITVYILALISNVFAETSNVITKKQPDSELSILGITIGKSTLEDVKSKFKSKDIYYQGDAGESLYVLCYKSSNGSTIAFESGETGGNAHTVSTISINGTKVPYRLNKICEKTSLIRSKLVINGISLGMSPDLIKRLKGKPSKQSANSLLYQFEIQEKNEKRQLDIISRLEIEFNQDIVSALTASKSETF